MTHEHGEDSGPDLVADGVLEGELADGAMLLGQADGETVLLARRGSEVFAVASTCTHYGGPLAEGVFEDGRFHCPWHHACFEANSGAPLRPPGLNPLAAFEVERRDGRLFVGARKAEPSPASEPAGAPSAVVIVGAGAAGNAAAETLRHEGYRGPITMIGTDESI